MKIIHHNGFSDQEREIYIPIIRRNLLDSLKVVLSILDEADRKPDGIPSGVEWSSGSWFSERALATSFLLRMSDHASTSSATCVETPTLATSQTQTEVDDEDNPYQVGQAVEKIWADPIVQRLVETMCSTYTSPSGLQLMDNAHL
jgi:hypothetical protein